MAPHRFRSKPKRTEAELLLDERRQLNARLKELRSRAPEPPEGTILTWTRTFTDDDLRPVAPGEVGNRYTYAALLAGGQWHLTGMDDKRYTWDELIDYYLDKADEGSVRVARPMRGAFVFRVSP